MGDSGYPSCSSDCKLVQRIVEGHCVLTMENDRIRISIDVDQGAHIFEITDKQTNINVLYQDPKGLADHDVGGWYELFPNAGKSCRYRDADIPGHGDVRHLIWEFNVQQQTAEEIQVALWTVSQVRSFSLYKTIAIRKHKSNLYMTEKITNNSAVEEHYLWGHHVTFGAPFISSYSRIDLPPSRIYNLPRYYSKASRMTEDASGTLDSMPGKQGESLDISYFPSEPASEMLFLDGLQDHWYNVFNEKQELGFALAWDRSVYPSLWLWQENCAAQQSPFNGQVYGMALEPQSSHVPILADAVAQGQAPVLQAGQSKESWLTAVLHHRQERVKHVSKQGEVTI